MLAANLKPDDRVYLSQGSKLAVVDDITHYSVAITFLVPAPPGVETDYSPYMRSSVTEELNVRNGEVALVRAEVGHAA
jgi:hypothetical protein